MLSEEKVRQIRSQRWSLRVWNMFGGELDVRKWGREMAGFLNIPSFHVHLGQRDAPSVSPGNPCNKLGVAKYFSSFPSLFRVRESIKNESMQYLIWLISFYAGQVTVDFVETAHIIGRLKWKTSDQETLVVSVSFSSSV